jgi:hypothetical protein
MPPASNAQKRQRRAASGAPDDDDDPFEDGSTTELAQKWSLWRATFPS